MEGAGKKSLVKWLGVIVALPLLGLAAYTWFVLSWSFASGERAGYVQKLSKKGWICKTWEGEMALVSMPGTVAEKFPFRSQRRDRPADKRFDRSEGRPYLRAAPRRPDELLRGDRVFRDRRQGRSRTGRHPVAE